MNKLNKNQENKMYETFTIERCSDYIVRNREISPNYSRLGGEYEDVGYYILDSHGNRIKYLGTSELQKSVDDFIDYKINQEGMSLIKNTGTTLKFKRNIKRNLKYPIDNFDGSLDDLLEI